MESSVSQLSATSVTVGLSKQAVNSFSFVFVERAFADGVIGDWWWSDMISVILPLAVFVHQETCCLEYESPSPNIKQHR